MRKALLLLFAVLLFPSPIFCQEEIAAETTEYSYDFYLDHLILWEDRLDKEEPLTLSERNEIQSLSGELETTVFRDLYLEAALLTFLAESKALRFEEAAEDPVLLEDFLKEAKNEKRSIRGASNKRFWKGFTLGSAIFGAGVFNILLYASEASYDNYLAAGDGNEAYFYQQRWELMDIGALGALGFVGINLIINGILQITDLL